MKRKYIIYIEDKGKNKKQLSLISKLNFLYKAISVASTLMFALGIVLFIYGHIANKNTSDNDLIMAQINNEIHDEDIVSLSILDVYGFGSESILVTASNASKIHYEQKCDNKFVIMDRIDNDFLHKMNDFFGFKSSYRTKFSYTIDSGYEMSLSPRIDFVIDIVGDSSKEIFVKYDVYGSTYGANKTAIFGYSFNEQTYKIIGTYPDSSKINLKNNSTKILKTEFIKSKINNSPCDFYDGNIHFNLNDGSWYCREYWIDSDVIGHALVIVNVDKYEKKTIINIYQPLFRDDELLWNALYSREMKNFPIYYTKEDIAVELEKILGFQIIFLESIGN